MSDDQNYGPPEMRALIRAAAEHGILSLPEALERLREAEIELNRLRAARNQAETEQDALAAYVKPIKTERDRLRAVVHELKRAADGPISDDDEDFTDDAYIQGNTTAWAYVLKVIEEGT